MSTDISRNVLGISRENYIKIFSVNIKNPETLAEFVKRIRSERNLSITGVEKKSRQGGRKGISNGYVSQIENGYFENVSTEKLKALAAGLGVTEEELFAVARGFNPVSGSVAEERFSSIAKGYEYLPEQEKLSIEPLLETIENMIRKSENQRESDQNKIRQTTSKRAKASDRNAQEASASSRFNAETDYQTNISSLFNEVEFVFKQLPYYRKTDVLKIARLFLTDKSEMRNYGSEKNVGSKGILIVEETPQKDTKKEVLRTKQKTERF